MNKNKKLSEFRRALMDIVLDLADHGNKWKMIRDRTAFILANTLERGKVLQFKSKKGGKNEKK